MTFFKARIQQ